jgi:ribosomal protein L21E
MAAWSIGDVVRVGLPKGSNKRGVMGISVLFTTHPEARFDGATGTIVEINPRGPYGVALYLVDFRDHENRVAVPWQAQWFREEWLSSARQPAAATTPAPAEAPAGELAAASGQKQTTLEGSS